MKICDIARLIKEVEFIEKYSQYWQEGLRLTSQGGNRMIQPIRAKNRENLTNKKTENVCRFSQFQVTSNWPRSGVAPSSPGADCTLWRRLTENWIENSGERLDWRLVNSQDNDGHWYQPSRGQDIEASANQRTGEWGISQSEAPISGDMLRTNNHTA